MRTRQLADQAGVNIETLRYYERRGLLPEPPRTSGGYRHYPDEAVRALRFVKRSPALGFSLAESQELLHLAAGGPDSCKSAHGLAVSHLTELNRRFSQLRSMREALVQLAESCTPADPGHGLGVPAVAVAASRAPDPRIGQLRELHRRGRGQERDSVEAG
jgi:DNA-binding transcriptional MerR regulator